MLPSLMIMMKKQFGGMKMLYINWDAYDGYLVEVVTDEKE